MKKLFAICFFMVITFTVNAQKRNYEKEIFDIQIKIMDKLNKITKNNYGKRYDGNDLTDWHYVKGIEKNNALYEFYYSDDEEFGTIYRYRIDLSKIGYLKMGETHSRNDAFFFYTKKGERAIQVYSHSSKWNLDIGGFDRKKDEYVDMATIHMPQDDELLDLFREAIDLIQKHKAIAPSEYDNLKDVEYFEQPVYNNTANSQNNSQEMQAAEAMGAMLEGLTFFNWEFVGRSTFSPVSTNSEEATYGIDEFRFNLILGKNHFRFNISPVGFSWLSLPTFKKYNDQGIKIGTVTNYSVKSYTPSAGLSYVLYPKADKGEEYRFVEFPLSVHFSPFLGFKNDNFKANDITDSEYKEYFSDFNYFVYSSFGISLFFSRDFGMSLKAGAFYLNVKESEKVLKHTDEDGISENFIVKFDEKSKILPAGELSFTLRF